MEDQDQDHQYLLLHHVSKTDTLAGIAIKYGLEVADIRHANGLVTDLQMFAHKTLKIPLPGRHPLTTSSIPDSEGRFASMAPPRLGKRIINFPNLCTGIPSDDFEKRDVSSSMNLLRGYYGLSSSSSSSPFSSSSQSVKEGIANGQRSKSVTDFRNWPGGEFEKVRNGNGNGNGNGTSEDERGEENNTLRAVRRRGKGEGMVGVSRQEGVGIGAFKIPPPPRPRMVPKAPLVGTDTSGLLLGPIEKTLRSSINGGKLTQVRRSCSTSDLQDEMMQADSASRQASKPDLTSSSSNSSSGNTTNSAYQSRFNSLGSLPFSVISKPAAAWRSGKTALD